jgi:hypothetical protein
MALCTAVGYDNGSTRQVPFADLWNGITWTTQPTPDRPAPSAASCPGLLPGRRRLHDSRVLRQPLPGLPDAGRRPELSPAAAP